MARIGPVLDGPTLDGIRTTRIFADGADLDSIVELAADPVIAGFTTNPTLMRSAGLRDFEGFARAVIDKVAGRPVSFGVCADDPEEVDRQARVISGWGPNVYVKVPVTTTGGEDLTGVAGRLSRSGVQVNVTAVFTVAQAGRAVAALDGGAPSIVSVFAGRIADAGVDPVPVVGEAVRLAEARTGPRILWASPRQVFDLCLADSVGCHAITMTPGLFRKVGLLGRDLEEFSRETVAMFLRDARSSGFTV